MQFDYGMQGISIFSQTAIKTEFADAFLDAIYTVNTVYFWDNMDQGFCEIYRLLKPGGIFVNAFYSKEWLDKLSYTNYDFKKYMPQELVESGKRSGFEHIEVQERKKDTAYCMILHKINRAPTLC